jgi:uncharacterized DUF497 family protein
MRDDEFEWDDRKAAANLADHDVSFAVARRAFDDVFAVEIEDRVKTTERTGTSCWGSSGTACWQ